MIEITEENFHELHSLNSFETEADFPGSPWNLEWKAYTSIKERFSWKGQGSVGCSIARLLWLESIIFSNVDKIVYYTVKISVTGSDIHTQKIKSIITDYAYNLGFPIVYEEDSLYIPITKYKENLRSFMAACLNKVNNYLRDIANDFLEKNPLSLSTVKDVPWGYPVNFIYWDGSNATGEITDTSGLIAYNLGNIHHIVDVSTIIITVDISVERKIDRDPRVVSNTHYLVIKGEIDLLLTAKKLDGTEVFQKIGTDWSWSTNNPGSKKLINQFKDLPCMLYSCIERFVERIQEEEIVEKLVSIYGFSHWEEKNLLYIKKLIVICGVIWHITIRYSYTKSEILISYTPEIRNMGWKKSVSRSAILTYLNGYSFNFEHKEILKIEYDKTNKDNEILVLFKVCPSSKTWGIIESAYLNGPYNESYIRDNCASIQKIHKKFKLRFKLPKFESIIKIIDPRRRYPWGYITINKEEILYTVAPLGSLFIAITVKRGINNPETSYYNIRKLDLEDNREKLSKLQITEITLGGPGYVLEKLDFKNLLNELSGSKPLFDND